MPFVSDTMPAAVPAGAATIPTRAWPPTQLAARLGVPPPTPQQTEIIEAPLEPMVVVAGAGSGKTETMAARIAWLVANRHVAPHEVLGLTFTRKAAGELAERLRIRLRQLRYHGIITDESEPTVATYHAYAGRIASEHMPRSGSEPPVQTASEAHCWQLASAVVHSYDGDMSAVDSAPDTVTEKVLLLASQMAEHLVSPDVLRDYLETTVATIEGLPPGRSRSRGGMPSAVAQLVARLRAKLQLVPLVEEYMKRKSEREMVDFGDILASAARLARDFPEVGRIERRRFRVVLLDEYQDTSHAQLVLLRSLFSAGDHSQGQGQGEDGRGHPVTAVGDPCQSIYGWRGASAGNLARFPWHFLQRDGQLASVRPLTTSWRNGEAILDIANAVAEPLRRQLRIDVSPLDARPGDDGKARVECALHDTVDAEAVWIAERIAEVRKGNEREGQAPTCAVLVRRRDQIDPIAHALKSAGLPVEIVGLGGLLSTPEVSDVVSALTVLSNPEAGNALMRLLSGPHCMLGARDIQALASRARDLAGEDDDPRIVEALDDLGPAEAYSPEGFRRLSRLAATLQHLRRRANASLPELISEVRRVFRLDIEVSVRNSSDPASAKSHLDAFREVAAAFVTDTSASAGATLPAFLAYLAAAEKAEYGLAAGKVAPRADAVQIVTVHAAKGLEWDVVAVAGLTSSVFPPDGNESLLWMKNLGAVPFPLRGDSADLPSLVIPSGADLADVGNAVSDVDEEWKVHELAEERRLAYVAVTRARRLLLASGYWWGAGKKPRGPSVFLDEVREQIAHDETHRSGREAQPSAVTQWAEPPAADAINPLHAQQRTAVWPADPLGERRASVEEAAALVRRMRMREVDIPLSHEAVILLAEREELHRRRVYRELPTQLTVGHLVAAHTDPEALARTVRRPLPRPGTAAARRGTSFHAALQQRFTSQFLFEIDDIPGAGDHPRHVDDEVPSLLAAFDASEWADRVPHAVEVPFSTVLNGKIVSGRIDAVYRGKDGEEWEVVDWKTGRVPQHDEQLRAAAVQLAAYRLAWADLAGVPATRVRAAFHYVKDNRTLYPEELLDADSLARLIPS